MERETRKGRKVGGKEKRRKLRRKEGKISV